MRPLLYHTERPPLSAHLPPLLDYGAQRELRELLLVGKISSALAAEAFPACLSQAIEVLRCELESDDCELFLAEPTGGDLVLTCCQGADQDVLMEVSRFEPGEGFPGIVTSERQLVVTRDLPNDRRYLREAVKARGIRSYVSLPLMDGQSILGSLHLAWRRADVPFEAVLRMLKPVEKLFAMAISAGLARRRESMRAVIDKVAPGSVDDQLLAVLELLRSEVSASHGTLFFFGGGQRGLWQRVNTAAEPGLYWNEGATRRGTCDLLERGHGAAHEASNESTCAGCNVHHGQGSINYCLPLLRRGALCGMVFLSGTRPPPGLPGQELVPLMVMAEEAASRLIPAAMPVPLIPLEAQQSGESRSVLEAERSSCLAGAEAQPLDLRCLGPFEIAREGCLLAADAFPRKKALTLLKILLLEVGSSHHRDVLIEQLWPDADEGAGINRFHVVVNTLRAVIEPFHKERRWLYVRNQGEHYQFAADAPFTLDLLNFRNLLARARKSLVGMTQPEDAVLYLAQATELYRGELFQEEPYAEWCAMKRVELQETFLDASRRLARLLAGLGRHEEAIDVLRRALLIDPLREDLHQMRIELLLTLGRRNDAREQYQDCLRMLREHLEAEPLAETIRLGRLLRAL